MIKTSQAPTRLLVLVAVSLVSLTIGLYLPARHHQFLNWDDKSYIVDNDHVRGGLTREGIVWAFTSAHSANWHPITWLSHMLDCELFGLQAGWHHVSNILFHGINVALLFLLLQRLTKSLWRSALVAALFGLHPLRVESVAWVAERKDVLSTCFGLLTLMAYVRFAQLKVPQPPPLRLQGWYALALIGLALGLMSKPMLVTWPAVMLLLDYWPLRRMESPLSFKKLGPLVIEKLPFIILALIACVVTVSAQRQSEAIATLQHLSVPARLQNAVVAAATYVGQFIWPYPLSPIYPLQDSPGGWRVGAAALVLMGSTGVAFRLRHRYPYLLMGWLWFAGTLVPVIGLVQVGSAAHADRYTYVPEIGLALAGVWWVAELAERRRWHPVGIALACATLLTGLSWRTAEQIKVWRDSDSMFRATLSRYPDCILALYGLAQVQVANGEGPEARVLLEKIARLQPDFPGTWGELADLNEAEGNYREALRCLRRALELQPRSPAALNNLAWLLASCPRAEFRAGTEAVSLAAQACELTRFSRPLFIGTLGAAQAEAGDFTAAIASAERAAALANQLQLTDLVQRNRAMIELYRSGRAAHGDAPTRP